MWPFNQVDKRKAIFVKMIGGVETRLGSAKLDSTVSSVSFKGTPYPINISEPAYRNKNKFFYYIDIGDRNTIDTDKKSKEYKDSESNGGQLQLMSTTKQTDSVAYDLLFNREIIKQILTSLGKTTWSAPLLICIVTMVMGLFGGMVLAHFIKF